MNYYEEKGDFLKYLRKTMRIMRLSLFLIVISTAMAFSANSYSQNTKLTLDLNNATVKEVLKAIENQSEFLFFYQEKHVDLNRQVTLHAIEQEVETILNQLFAGTENIYVINDRQIVIGVAPRKELERQILNLKENVKPVLEQPRQKEITGKVTDTGGLPVPGVSVIVKGTTIGTVTNTDGEFSLNIPLNAETIQFSFVGMRTQEVPIEGRTTFTVVMEEDFVGIEEVVAIGYGTMRRSDLTGSVVSVTQESIAKTVNSSFEDAMLGRSSGVHVSSHEGSPGGGISITIRGGTSISASNSPLYVVDGFPIIEEGGSINAVGGVEGNIAAAGSNILSTINPNDIESIDILKDASATAIYGSRGANGVIIITTKKGSVGDSKLTYDGYYGVQQISKKLEMLNSLDYARFRHEYWPEDSTYMNPESFADSVSTNWQNEIYQIAPIQNHQIGFSGGNKDVQYNISTGYFKQEGIIKTSSFERYSIRSNISGRLNRKLSFNSNISFSSTFRDGAPTGGGNAVRSGVVTQALLTNPTIKTSEDILEDPSAPDLTNPITSLNETTNTDKTNRFIANLSVDYQLFDGLTLKFLLGANMVDVKQKRFYSSKTGIGRLFNGQAFLGDVSNQNWVNENTLNYLKQWSDKHNLNAMLGFTMQGAHNERFVVINRNFDIQKNRADDIGVGTNVGFPSSVVEEWGIMSYLSRINYNYDNKYLLTASIRADGSSRFADGNKWGYFPSLGFAWRLSNENILKNISMLSNAKLRIGYGQTGNQEVGRYNSLASMNSGRYAFGVRSGLASTTASTTRVANPDLSWEKTNQTNLGLDLGFFNHRLNFTFDVYDKTTTDLLLAVSLLPTSGIGAPALKNIGKINNKGFELSVNTVNIQNNNFIWSTDFNISANRNKVLDLGEDKEILLNPRWNNNIVNMVIIRENESVSSFYGYQTIGIYQLDNEEGKEPGTRIYKDLSGPDGVPDGIINAFDRTIIGNALPKHFGGINNNLSYKNLELSIFFNWSYGNDVFNANRYFTEGLEAPSNQTINTLNRWTMDNPSNTIPKVGGEDTNLMHDAFIEDGSFLRLRNVTLSYSFPARIVKRTFMENLKVFATAQNLFTITKYSGYDPEVNITGDHLSQGIDWGAYPQSKIYTFGVNVIF